MDLINPNSNPSKCYSIGTFLKTINPLYSISPKVGAFCVLVIDLVLTLLVLICGIVLETYLIYPDGFKNEEELKVDFRNQYIVMSATKIYIFLILVGLLVIVLSEYGLFTILRDGINQKDKHLAGLWFEIRLTMFCVMLGAYLTYSFVERSSTFDTEIPMSLPFFIYKFYALWIVKHFEYTTQWSQMRDDKERLSS